MRAKRIVLPLMVLALLTLLPAISARALARAQEHVSEPAQAAPEDKSVGGERAKETRQEAWEEEENENLKHSGAIRYLARKTGMRVHQVHLLAIGLNFAIIGFLVYWFARKSVPAALRKRTESIRRALEEARAASQEANRRLGKIETRLRQLDVEIGQMQAAAEKEAEAEEVRIRKAAEEDVRKVVQAAEQEIAAAAKQARRELTSHTADLAVALARKQIHVDPATDQALVRNFAGKLLSGNGGKGGR
ncbi:MAG: ATP synthase F0 subunit B [Candidatus Koribacter versatilis]|nr:ATP synthase F0 subunit B [Candidatus Koribacter versatilis]